MGLRTKDVKRAWRHGDVDYPGPPKHGKGTRVRLSPDRVLAVAWVEGEDGTAVIRTVLWHGRDSTRPCD